jgi:opacity protein-like surface antigen
MRGRNTRRLGWALGALLLGAAACANADPLGLYVGAGAGESTLRQDSYGVDAHPTGWKVLVGWHPIHVFGTELEYVDLGSHSGTSLDPAGATSYSVTSSASAPALFMLGYLPLPLPWLDLYGKVGAARLRTKVNGTGRPNCAAGHACPLIEYVEMVDTDMTQTRLAYGAGAQFRFGAPALRLEYERFTASNGDQTLLSLDLLLNF